MRTILLNHQLATMALLHGGGCFNSGLARLAFKVGNARKGGSESEQPCSP
jgi:hypothetical protein